jgi:hypothetical protein
MPSGPVSLLLERLKGVKRLGKGWIARCPAHDDGEPSLKIDEGDAGTALVFCHAGCSTEAVCGALGISASDLFVESLNNGNGARREVASYTWVDANARAIAIHERFDTLVAGRWKKEMPWRRPDGKTGLGGIKLPPYRLPQLLNAITAGDVVLLVEGEKAAESLVQRGYNATTTGSTTSWRPDHAQHFRGARVVIWPDADAPGEKYGATAAADLLGIAGEVRVIRWPDKSSGWDAADFWAEGGTTEQLDQLLADAPWWTSAEDVSEPEAQEKDEPARRLYTLISDVEAETLPPPIWSIDGIYPENAFVVVFGQRGKGKTFLALGWAFSHGTGLPWLERTVTKGPVIYVLAEGRGGLGKRVRAQKQHLRLEGPADVHFITTAVPMLNIAEVDRLICTIETLGTPPSAIVWDTLSRTFIGGDENSSKDMASYVAAIDRVKETVGGTAIVQHHTGHSTTDRERGSSVLGGAADTICALRDEDGLQLTCEKQKDAQEFTPIPLSLYVMQEAGSCVLKHGGTYVELVPPWARSGLARFHDMFGENWASSSDWKESSEVKPSTFNRMRNLLTLRHLVARMEVGRSVRYRITEEGLRMLRFQQVPR